MNFFLRPLSCLFGLHDLLRSYEGEVLKYRCLSCYEDLGPILQRDEKALTRLEPSSAIAPARLTNATTTEVVCE